MHNHVQHGLLLLALCWLAGQAAGAKTVHVVFSNHLVRQAGLSAFKQSVDDN
jgi:hypothetical protein